MKNLRLIFGLSLLLASACFGQTTTNNVVILLDTSGSMNDQMQSVRESRMDVAKRTLIDVVGKLPEDTNIGLLNFDGWVYPLGPLDRQVLVQGIADCPISPNGTPLGTYMKIGADSLLAKREENDGYGSYKLLVVTDGEANNEAENLVDDHTMDITGRGITVDCIGLDLSSTHSLATKVNSYMSADDPESFKESLSTSLVEIPLNDENFSNEIFEEVGALEPEVVYTIVQNLNNPSNHPIGEPDPVVEEFVAQTPPVQPELVAADQGSGSSCCMVVPGLMAVITIIIIIGMTGGGSRRGRI